MPKFGKSKFVVYLAFQAFAFRRCRQSELHHPFIIQLPSAFHILFASKACMVTLMCQVTRKNKYCHIPLTVLVCINNTARHSLGISHIHTAFGMLSVKGKSKAIFSLTTTSLSSLVDERFWGQNVINLCSILE